eukprot:c20818_g1_i1 orf=702-3656(-)
MASSEEALKAENARLVAEIAFMKKKVMVALKKQQAELQAKIQAAEERALIAEAAAAAANSATLTTIVDASSGENGQRLNTHESLNAEASTPTSTRLSPATVADGHTTESSTGGGSPQISFTEVSSHERTEIMNDSSLPIKERLPIEVERLNEQLAEEERDQRKMQEDSTLVENQRLVEEISELRVKLVNQTEEADRMKEKFDLEMHKVKWDAAAQIEQLKKLNTMLEDQLSTAAEQLSGAVARIASTPGDMEYSAKEGNEACDMHAKLLKEHGSACEELEKICAALLEAQKGAEKMEASSEAWQIKYMGQSDLALLGKENTELSQLQLENELEAQIQAGNSEGKLVQSDWQSHSDDQTLVKETEELRKQLQASIVSQQETDGLVKQLREACAEAERRAENLSQELGEVQRKMNEEIKARDEKYVELDSKFGKLQKRVKQHIQGLQKEKEDVEVQLVAATEKAAQALLQQTTLQQDLECMRTQAGEALRSLDGERQQLRNANNRQREIIDELQHVAESKESELREARRLASEKDQQVKDLTDKLEEVEAKKEAAITDLVTKKKDEEIWSATIESFKRKMEESEKAHLQEQLAAAKARRELELELKGQQQALSASHTELDAARKQVTHLENEFSAYKVRAYSLLQKKEAELSAAKDVACLAAQEAALKEAERQAASAVAERDSALKSLQDVVAVKESQLATRALALLDAEQKICEMATKLESAMTQLSSEQEAWQSRLNELNGSWQSKYEALEAKLKEEMTEDINKELGLIQKDYDSLKTEYDSFREIADNMMEAKDQEIAHLLDEMREMQKSTQTQMKGSQKELAEKAAPKNDDTALPNIALAEQQILLLARQQAQREEELVQYHRHIQALQEEITELEHENRLHAQQEAMLKDELRNLERSKKREGVDMTYLKNVIVKLLETGEVEALLPVIAMLLQFSPQELKKCQEAYNVVPDLPLSSAPAVANTSASASRTLLSRLTFSKT